jgi:ribonuclease-3
MKTVNEFLKASGLEFNNYELIRMALTHPSYAQEKNVSYNNQRLEFLGDAVLNFVVGEYLYRTFPAKAEGELTRIRARVVCETSLHDVAAHLNLGEYLLLGKGEDLSGGRKRKSILADAVEAVIGALYLDQGYPAARDFVLRQLAATVQEVAAGDYQDYKSRLQELVQAHNKENVSYSILEESGPAHARLFVAGVFFQERLLATGTGRSKKEAEQKAAAEVLRDESIIKSLLHGDETR